MYYMLDRETREKIVIGLARGQGISKLARECSVSVGIVSLYRSKYRDKIQSYRERLTTALVDDRSAEIIRDLERQIDELTRENVDLRKRLDALNLS